MALLSQHEATGSPRSAFLPALRALPTPPPRPLLGSSADFWILGGGSVVFLLLCHVLLRHEGPSAKASWFIFNLSFLVNFPHFLSSYHMLYGDFRKELLRRPRYLWAGIVVPAVLFGLFTAGIQNRSMALLGGLANAMFFFVGWHYAKQTFGVMVVCNARRNVFFTKLERHVLRANLLSIWMVSWTRFATPATGYSFQGFTYRGFGLPAWIETAAIAMAALTTLAVIAQGYLKYIREGKIPSAGAVAGWLAFQAWYLPAFAHPAFALTIPFFHSFQYLGFVVAFRRSKAKKKAGDLATPRAREIYLRNFHGQFFFCAATGALLMWALPKFLDSLQIAQTGWHQPTVFFASFTIFINIHHYFIDNVLWRSDNPEMREHLFS